MSDKTSIIEPGENDDLVRWAHGELWDGMSDAGRAAWMTGYLILKLRRRARRAKLETIVRCAVSVIDAAERLRDLHRERAGHTH
jgi:hypothetical protein